MATYRWAEGLDKHCSSGLGCIWSTHSLWNESLQAFKTSFLHPPAPLFLHEAPGSMGEPADYQEFPNAACREEWKLVGNGLRVTVLSMEGRCGQESLRQTGKYNPDGGVPLCQHSSGQERERQTQTDRQTGKEGGRERRRERGDITVSAFLFSMVCGNLAIPFQWNTICLDLGTWTHLNCPGALFLSLRLSWNSIPC